MLISHDHYDHLDEPTVRRLAQKFDPRFVVPLGIGAWLADRGITNAVELDWGESATVKGLTVVCTPAQHGGGRTAIDQGRPERDSQTGPPSFIWQPTLRLAASW